MATMALGDRSGLTAAITDEEAPAVSIARADSCARSG
jgi:hypothetical protein